MNRYVAVNYLIVLIMLLINEFNILSNNTISINQYFNNNANVKQVVLNNSYYFQYSMFNQESGFKLSMVRSYFVLNIDGDEYLDLLIWYPGKLMIWSYRYGVFSSYRSSLYISKPIPIDYNKDGVLDYVLVIESDYMDAAIPEMADGSFYSYLTKWEPLRGGRFLGSVRNAFVDTSTYHVIGDYVFIPTVFNNYQSFDWNSTRKYISTIGLLRFHISTCTYTHYTIKTYTIVVPEKGKLSVNDYTTNYEIYLIGSGNTMYLIPSGLDRVIRVRHVSDSIILDKEYSIGNTQWNDNVMLIGRDYPAIPFGAYTTDWGAYWRSPQKLDIKLIESDLIIPTAEFGWLNPTDSENGVYFRVERIRGVVVLSTTGQYREEVLLNRLFSAGGRTYTVRIITSVFIDSSSSLIYYGGIGATSDMAYHVAFVNTINYRTGEHRNIWYKEIFSQAFSKKNFQVTISSSGSKKIFTTLYALRVESDSRDVYFHSFQNIWKPPWYTQYPPSTINPIILDIDKDGTEEYVFVMQYADYTPYYYSPGGICGLYPVVRNGANYIVWIKKPVLLTKTTCIDETCRELNIEYYYFISTKYSSSLLEIRDSSGNIVYRKNISGNTVFRDKVVFQNTGRYSFDTYFKTIYYVDEWIDGSGSMDHVVTYSENILSLITIFVRYRTRISINKPYLQTMTPNHYANGLEVVFTLEYQNFNDNKWYRLPGQSSLLTVSLINSTNTIINKPSDVGNGIYRTVIYNIVPSTYSLRVDYAGSSTTLPISITISLNLVQYPVVLNTACSLETPALTPFTVNISLKYRYIDDDGKWIEDKLTTGRSIELQVYYRNNPSMVIYRNNYSVTTTVLTIPKEKIQPGEYGYLVKYIPNNIYYSQAYSTGYYRVYRLKLWVDIVDLLDNKTVTMDSQVIYGSTIQVEIREYISNTTYRQLSVNMMILFHSINYTYNLTTRNTITLVDTICIKPGNYTVYVFPLEYSWCYEPYGYTFYVNLVEAKGKITGLLKPFIELNTFVYKNEKNALTYALTPVVLYINTSIYPRELEKKAIIKIIIDNKTYVLENLSKQFVFTPVKPGYKEIKLVLETPFLKIYNYTYLTVYPHPVRVIVEKGSIVIKTIDLLNRSAPGTLSIEVYDMYKKLILRNTYETNGLLVIPLENIQGWIYIYVDFKGNESYAEAKQLKYIYIGFNNVEIKTVNEIPILNFIILIVLIMYLLKKNKKYRYH